MVFPAHAAAVASVAVSFVMADCLSSSTDWGVSVAPVALPGDCDEVQLRAFLLRLFEGSWLGGCDLAGHARCALAVLPS